MATCIKRPGAPVPPPDTYVLELTRDEAIVIKCLAGRVGGSGTLRAAASSVWCELENYFPEVDSYELGLRGDLNFDEVTR